jgi:uncharacterized peroxidase-related enzyme
MMSVIEVSNIEMVDETTTDSEVSETYEQIRKGMQLPFVPNLFKSTAGSPAVLSGSWGVFNNVFVQSSLPIALKAMILYSIASANNCEYCSVVHQATCKSLGVDESTLKMLTDNLKDLEPRRVQAIVDFALKVADLSHSLQEEDYENVRDQGVTEEELVEIIGLAALGNYLDSLADAFKIDVDGPIKDALKA